MTSHWPKQPSSKNLATILSILSALEQEKAVKK